MTQHSITTLFCDIGGVLLTNGWDHTNRTKAAEQFGFDIKEFNARHQMCFYLFEIGKISLQNYLEETLFYQPRSFTVQQFVEFMYAQSQPFTEMITFIRALKQKHQLKVVLLSNEGRELTEYRLKHFGLRDIADFFIVSGFVHVRKPDHEIFRMALDLVQTAPEGILYIDDRQMFIEIASKLGIHAFRHVDLAATQKAIESLFSGR